MPKKKEAAKKEEAEELEKKEPITGSGRFVFPDGTSYEGEWIDNGDGVKMKHGKGVLKIKGGVTYDGEWDNDAKQGTGVCAHVNGDVYEGAFGEGKYHGKGKFVWRNGAKYEGDWANGKMHGNGEFIDGCGNRFRGQFRENRFLNETGCYISPKDDTVGEFKCDDYVPRYIGTCIKKVDQCWFSSENKAELFKGKVSQAQSDSFKRLFRVEMQLPEEVFSICKQSTEGYVAFMVIFGQIFEAVNSSPISTLALVEQVEQAVKAAAPEVEKLDPFKKLFVHRAMAVADEKELSEAGVAGIETAAGTVDNPLLKEIAEFFKTEIKETVDLISQFGRDPRKNALRGRESTEEEQEWLKANAPQPTAEAGSEAKDGDESQKAEDEKKA
uniref:Radial spoke protein 10 n=1 Tax=Lotharella globosa TaxID=91324 RepID=A0A7S4E1Z1_9EUKA|mmetsp:Transcript_10327/g.20509  ORF Transcript_10327/g.20509 Transcript_10327/m.20509 type:complete len:384 (+) Transcript_10327:72-1223(+)|eukprot:CAMPEP_0167816676 /NCGR_PEP_ID=MMETSP0112_2-20121227/3752_1 /TAXON_ID=91324 /ORGANISM="Lotharella globosa, Strain CCCM811" /LENGTH=383 /DNA_ID=CAMNT_0007716317 /DNA_START=60 /DNA_END=1211 /DNA_ORIENTATION=+